MNLKALTVSLFLALAEAKKYDSERIVGGEEADVGEFPWVVWLGKNDQLRCHGSLIREDLVLTSKSCLKEINELNAAFAYIGVWKRGKDVQISPSEKIRIISSSTNFGNLVVLKLKKSADISKNYLKNKDVIQTATKREERQIRNGNQECYIAGWGFQEFLRKDILVLSKILQKLKVKFVKNKSRCRRIKGFDRKTEMCYKVSETEGPCDYDDGAPIMCRLQSDWLLVGVDTGKRAKNKNVKDFAKRCRGGLVAPIRASAYYKDIQKRIDDVFGDASSPEYPMDCTEAKSKGTCTGSGPCDLSLKMPYGYKNIKAVCDQTTAGGGWTVIQRRFDGSVDFYKKFSKYEFGFGAKSGEHWLGLKWISALASNGNTEMRIDLENHRNETAYQVFSDFGLGRARKYILNVGQSSGTAGDNSGFQFDSGATFSTYDNGRYENLAVGFHTGWWLKSSSGSFVNLNGQYGEPGTVNVLFTPVGGFTHVPFNDLLMLKSSTMMVRKPRS